MTGPSAQRSKQPALLTRTFPGPERPSCLTLLLAYSNKANALWRSQQSSPLLRWLRQKNKW